MHGFAPRILHTLPKEGRGLTTREIQASLEANGTRAPSITTIRAHVFELRRLGLVYSEGRRHWRLADSVLDARPAADLAFEEMRA